MKAEMSHAASSWLTPRTRVNSGKAGVTLATPRTEINVTPKTMFKLGSRKRGRPAPAVPPLGMASPPLSPPPVPVNPGWIVSLGGSLFLGGVPQGYY